MSKFKPVTFPRSSQAVALGTSIRHFTATILNLVLISQGVMFIGSGSVTAQSRREQANKRVQKASKKKNGKGARVIAPLIWSSPSFSSGKGDEAAQSSPAVTQSRSTQPQNRDGEVLSGTRIQPGKQVQVSFRKLSETKGKAPRIDGSVDQKPAPPPMTIDDSPNAAPSAPKKSAELDDIPGPSIPSPVPSQNFLGQEDAAKVGTSTFTIPPDTMGAVGRNELFVNLNNNYRIQNKATGAPISTVSIDTFWTSTGASGTFDPRVVYDPYNDRWIVAAVSNALTANSSVLVGISQTADPAGAYDLFRFTVGCAAGAVGCNANGEWADFPMLGFNKNWVVVSWNQFTITTAPNPVFIVGKAIVLNYPTLRTGTADGTLFTGTEFCFNPANTYSATEETLQFVNHIGSAGATYRGSTMSGTPAAPSITLGPTRTRPGGGWTQPGGDIMPQQCVPGVSIPTQTCPVTVRRLDSGDAFVRSNVITRDGKTYYSQTIALPAGGLTLNSRLAAQWTVVDSAGIFLDGGRVEDATATITNGGQHYAYPSINVNKNGDVLLGFSNFESDDYADAGYTFRQASDAAGTMRDPVIYKEGEDYYEKTFSGSRNRWGDYSHTLVDPVNDRDLWTLQEYAQARVGTTGLGSNDSRWGTWWAKITAPAGSGELIISEFRLRGPSGANDEFVEIFNAGGTDLTVQTADGSAGYALVASDGTARFTIPNGTVIPAKGHFLGVNSNGYSLSGYPAGSGTTATGDATYTLDIPDNAGIALFNTATPANFTLANRLDAAGSTSEANTLYKEGTGYPAITPFFNIDYSWVRSLCPGNTPVFGTALGCLAGATGLPKDSNANQSDFVFVDTNGTNAGGGQRLGAPGPENLSSPIERNASFGIVLLDASVAGSTPPNRVRDFTADPANNSTFGTLELRRRVVNNTSSPVTRLRFRVADINTFPAASGFADLRTRTSVAVVVSGVNDAATCSPNPTPCTVTVEGTTIEQPPSQPNGGAFNTSYSAGTITLATPLAPGASVNVRFLLGIQQTGNFRFFLNVEALP